MPSYNDFLEKFRVAWGFLSEPPRCGSSWMNKISAHGKSPRDPSCFLIRSISPVIFAYTSYPSSDVFQRSLIFVTCKTTARNEFRFLLLFRTSWLSISISYDTRLASTRNRSPSYLIAIFLCKPPTFNESMPYFDCVR